MSLAQLRKPKMTDTSPLYTERLTAEEEKQMAREIRKAEQEAREVAEEARETDWKNRSFARRLFEGNLDLGLIDPPPEPDRVEIERGKPFLEKAKFLPCSF